MAVEIKSGTLSVQIKNSFGASGQAVEVTFRQVAAVAFEDLRNDNFRYYQKVTDDNAISKKFFTLV
jgi:hypothetical protein